MPPSVYGSGGVSAATASAATLVPTIEPMLPGTIGACSRLAALVTPAAVKVGGGPTGTFTTFERPPPAIGWNTRMVPRPAFATSATRSEIRSVLALTIVVGWSAPFQRTRAPAPKFAPLTVTVTGPRPGMLAGETESIRGA